VTDPTTNGTVAAEERRPLKRAVYYDRVTELLEAGVDRVAAMAQVAEEFGTTASNISGGYYSERRVRTLELTEGVDPAAAIAQALQDVEEAVARAKLVIASATMQLDRFREDAERYAELRRLIK
jgi:hypothetical protein